MGDAKSKIVSADCAEHFASAMFFARTITVVITSALGLVASTLVAVVDGSGSIAKTVLVPFNKVSHYFTVYCTFLKECLHFLIKFAFCLHFIGQMGVPEVCLDCFVLFNMVELCY